MKQDKTPSKRVLFLGDRPLGERCLRHLIQSGRSVVGVVSRPDQEQCWWGHGHFQEICRENSLQWHSHSDALEQVADQSAAGLGLSVLFTRIIPESVLKKVGFFNLHCAPLPEYKGFNSTLWAIINGDKTFGVTLHEVTPEPDGGRILHKRCFPLQGRISNAELYRTAHLVAFEVFCDAIQGIMSGNYELAPQVGSGKFYRKNELPSRELDLAWDPEKISRFARAFYFPPFESAYFFLKGQKYYVIPNS